MVTDKDRFYTMEGYGHSASDGLTPSMEDYLEMVCRMEEEGDPIRASPLAVSPHVRPSSAFKMLDSLKKAGCIGFKKYGSIVVTEEGYEEGKYLLYRHQMLQDFLCTLSHTEDELELAERVEHFINRRAVANMEQTLPLLRSKSDVTGKMGQGIAWRVICKMIRGETL